MGKILVQSYPGSLVNTFHPTFFSHCVILFVAFHFFIRMETCG